MISVQGFILQSHQHRDAIPKGNRDQVRTGDSPKTRKRHGAILILEWRRAVGNRMDLARVLKHYGSPSVQTLRSSLWQAHLLSFLYVGTVSLSTGLVQLTVRATIRCCVLIPRVPLADKDLLTQFSPAYPCRPLWVEA